MSRSNGSGVPPNGWPVDYRPVEATDPYNDPYYAQPPQRPAAPQQVPAQPPGQNPHQNPHQNPQTAGRAPRIQGGPLQAPSRGPQSGLPNAGLPPAYAQQSNQPNPNYAPPQHRPQPAPAPYIPAGQPLAHGHQNHPQAYTPPPQAPAFSQSPPRAPQQPQQRAAPTQQSGQHPGQHLGFEQTARPTQQPAYQPQYAAPGSAAYVPETTARPTQPPQQRAPANFEGYAPAAPAAVDPHGYDLGNYMPATTADPRTQRATAQPAWQPHADPQELSRQQSLNTGYAAQPPAHEEHDLQLHPAGHEDEEYDEHHEDDEYDEEPRKTRYGLIAASLLFAISAGGGLAYAYKMFAGSQSHSATAIPVVKSNQSAIKIKPVDAGGTRFANADSKVLEQLSGSNPDTPTDGGPKAVKTIVIPRDGSPNSPPPQDAVPASAPSGGVPGMILAGGPPQPRVPQPAQAPMAAAPVTIQPPIAPVKPTRIVTAAVQPPPASVDYDSTQAAPAAPPVKKPIVKKVAPPSAVGGPTGANGFVAVLASVPASASSRMDAMQQYADLQQKFAGVLGSKSPDVVEAKLGEKGTFHRLVVGPPGSRDAAGAVCAQLKAAGYTADCWVTAF